MGQRDRQRGRIGTGSEQLRPAVQHGDAVVEIGEVAARDRARRRVAVDQRQEPLHHRDVGRMLDNQPGRVRAVLANKPDGRQPCCSTMAISWCVLAWSVARMVCQSNWSPSRTL